ncbi:uncharacterized protein B0I36DRAFT_249881 [Microdochium trichocladiopsis]|uniref:Ferric oxidoreductase domain-containing protein n=1 Tax=Microdochium trichocladiopsis TaxID=1682393 RepID=A0A9P8XXW7_9PEZI|nr:uncharacterized protein B0I36DRAFT_249881 [Microdochium trichocladiopsis]KAH7024841.1 hypothetical protein B0I36DRAFT_249881 [Microdochium trichocladiopsis]
MKRPFQIVLILLSLALSAGLAIALTYAPCYATLCSEQNFPFETRLQITIFYALLASICGFLLLRVCSPTVRKLSDYDLSLELPILQKHTTLGGVILSIWIVGTTLATTGFWAPAELSFWGLRTDPLHWTTAKIELTVTGITGHYADILLGLVILPVSRNSLFGHSFEQHRSTLLFAHNLIAYSFLVAVLVHGIAYGTYAGDTGGDGDAVAKEQAFSSGNPTMTFQEGQARSSWYGYTSYTGIVAVVFMIIITATALPFVRRRNYNIFYYCHMICSVCIFVAACVHASTNFYFLLPGLFLWIIDWGWRFFRGETGGLHKKITGTLENAGGGWYRFSLSTSAGALGSHNRIATTTGKEVSPSHPIQSYYLNIPAVSRIQNHAFTAAKTSSTTSSPVFLLQRSTGKNQKKLVKEWTWKLGRLVPEPGDRKELEARVEGPYLPRETGFETASHIICIVGGTGITGAHSLAAWWLRVRASALETKFTLIWTVRQRETTTLREWMELEVKALSTPNLTLSVHASSEKGRLDLVANLRRLLRTDQTAGSLPQDERISPVGQTAWVYASGPATLLRSAEDVCIDTRTQIKTAMKRGGNSPWTVEELDWYIAKWEL